MRSHKKLSVALTQKVYKNKNLSKKMFSSHEGLLMEKTNTRLTKFKLTCENINPEVAGSNPVLVNFSLFIQNLSKNAPSQFPLWIIT